MLMRFQSQWVNGAVRACLVLGISIAVGNDADGAIRYVNIDLTSGGDDGTSWENAYRGPDSLTRALAAASAGDELWVVAGTYSPPAGDAANSFVLRSGVQTYGGFVGTEASRDQRDPVANVTMLSGLFSFNHVVTGTNIDASTVLDGLTIARGRGTGTGDSLHGAGMFLVNASPTVRRCIFYQNHADGGNGGGSYLRSSSPRFEDCTWNLNASMDFNRGGGGLYMEGASNPVFDRCAFTQNFMYRNGGGCYINGTSQPRFNNTLFRDNGGGGAGTNINGGAMLITNQARAVLRNCTVTGNTASSGGAASGGVVGPCEVYNSIVYGNRGSFGSANVQIGGAVSVTYSCVEFGYAGAGNISAAPLFVNSEVRDFHLQLGSPCIDAGRNCPAVPSPDLPGPDLDGRPRFQDEPTVADTGLGVRPIVDMGAYEFVPTGPAPCRSDWNGSGATDSQDLFDFLTSFFALNADFNHNCVTDSQDFFDFLAVFLGGCT